MIPNLKNETEKRSRNSYENTHTHTIDIYIDFKGIIYI